jgi:hypothetical protein
LPVFVEFSREIRFRASGARIGVDGWGPGGPGLWCIHLGGGSASSPAWAASGARIGATGAR